MPPDKKVAKTTDGSVPVTIEAGPLTQKATASVTRKVTTKSPNGDFDSTEFFASYSEEALVEADTDALAQHVAETLVGLYKKERASFDAAKAHPTATQCNA